MRSAAARQWGAVAGCLGFASHGGDTAGAGKPHISFIALEDACAYRHCAPVFDGAATLCMGRAHGARAQLRPLKAVCSP